MVSFRGMQSPNLRIGRRQFFFDFTKPRPNPGGALEIEGIAVFADKDRHDQACEIARMHKRDFSAMVDSREVVPVVSEEFPEMNGFYRLTDFDLDSEVSFPFHPLTLELRRLGSANDLRFESRLIGTFKENDHSVTEAGSEPLHAPPPHTTYNPRHSTTITREVAYEGDLTIYRDIDYSVDPTWSALPEDWYVGAATVRRRDPLYPQYGPVVGTSLFSAYLEDYELENGLCRFAMVAGVGQLEFWDEAAWRTFNLNFRAEGGNFTNWDHIAILLNRPDRCIVVYEGADNGNVRLTVSLRRGDRGPSFTLTNDNSGTLGIQDASATAMTDQDPYMEYTSADANGHKLMFVSTKNYTATGASALMEKATTTRFDVGVMLQLSGAAAGNTNATMSNQYFAALAEEVRTVNR